MLTLFNGSNLWWGEGDEKIYVDGESFPSHFGTGTEDYYGYAWYSVVPFSSPFLDQPVALGNRTPGITVNSRYRALDVIPFEKSFTFDMEIWHWDRTKMDYAPTTFWYGTADAVSNSGRDIDGVKVPVRHTLKIEGESFRIKPSANVSSQVESFMNHQWSGMSHMRVTGLEKGSVVEASFYSEEAHVGPLIGAFTHGPGYVALDVFINERIAFKGLNLHGPDITPQQHVSKTVNISKGENSIKFVVLKPAQPTRIADRFGIDYLDFKSVRVVDSSR